MARCITAGSSHLQPSRVFIRVSKLLAIAGILSLAPVFAADPTDTKTKSTGKAVRDKDQAESVPIPESISKLDLTAKQQEQIREIVREYDESINSVWNQYRDRYMQTIVAESTMLAAIEDGLTDTQRTQIREHRRKTANHRKTTVVTTNKPNLTNEKSNDTDVIPAGVSLNKEQEAAADQVHQKYRSHLRSLNQDIHGLHKRLLSLEADKLAEIEAVLTKEQLTQLRANRQNAPEMVKITIGRNEPAKSE